MINKNSNDKKNDNNKQNTIISIRIKYIRMSPILSHPILSWPYQESSPFRCHLVGCVFPVQHYQRKHRLPHGLVVSPRRPGRGRGNTGRSRTRYNLKYLSKIAGRSRSRKVLAVAVRPAAVAAAALLSELSWSLVRHFMLLLLYTS